MKKVNKMRVTTNERSLPVNFLIQRETTETTNTNLRKEETPKYAEKGYNLLKINNSDVKKMLDSAIKELKSKEIIDDNLSLTSMQNYESVQSKESARELKRSRSSNIQRYRNKIDSFYQIPKKFSCSYKKWKKKYLKYLNEKNMKNP